MPHAADNNKARHAWSRLIGRVWYHDDPTQHFAAWQAAFERGEIYRYPQGCDKEAVVDVIDTYVRRPWLSHPWLDWCFLDALVRWEAIAWADEIALIQADVLGPASRPRPWIIARLSKGSDRRRAQAIRASTAPHRAALQAMLKVYADLAGKGWTISPTRIRDTMVAAETSPARWEPVCYALIDRVIARDPAVWNYAPKLEAVDWN